MSVPASSRPPHCQVRRSRIQGRGVFALRTIRRGTKVLEYTGERISQEEAVRRYDDDARPRAHVVLFAVDDETVIDGGSGGSDARFVNHSCAPNCEAVEDEGRIFIRALRTIGEGEELTYDYRLQLPGRRSRKVETRYSCRCGAPDCRGTMLEPRPRSVLG
ncbi:MAG: SET domain-containing protein-lysine N-methyltransferase [bacterium]|nr:SET domain-containing protein-lysine N-methyltransferase [bacterium]